VAKKKASWERRRERRRAAGRGGSGRRESDLGKLSERLARLAREELEGCKFDEGQWRSMVACTGIGWSLARTRHPEERWLEMADDTNGR
jgi:hypothetical protein